MRLNQPAAQDAVLFSPKLVLFSQSKNRTSEQIPKGKLMINLIRFLLLLSLFAPTAKGQDSAATPLPSPTAPSDESPIAPASPPPVDPLALEPPVVDHLNLKPVDELKPARIVMEIPEPEITAEEVQKLLVSVYGEKDVAVRVKVIKEDNPLTLELYSPMDQTVRGLIQVRRMDSREQKKANRSSSDTAEEKEVADRVKVIKENNPFAPEVDSPRDRIVYLKNAGAESVQSIVDDIFGADVTTGVDSRTNVVILSGPAAKLHEALALVDKLDTADPAPAEMQETQKRASSYRAPSELKMGPAERRVGELLEERRLSLSSGTGNATIDDEQEKSLREAIAAAFDERQAQQLAEIEELSTRLQELSKKVQGRQAKPQQMIERRLSDLLEFQSLESDELPQPQTLESSFRGVRTEEALFSRNPVILFFGAGDDEDSLGQIALMHRLQHLGHPVELVDIRDNPKLAARFEIQQTPTVITVRDGAERARIVGPTTLQNLYSDIVKATHRVRMPLMNESLDPIEEKETLPLDYTAATFGGVLYFRADFSKPCLEMDKTVERLRVDGAYIETIEVDKHPKAAKQYDVEVVPSLVLIRQGKVFSSIEGFTSYENIRAQFDPKSHEFRPKEIIGHADSQRAPGAGILSDSQPVKLSALKIILVNKGASLTLEADARIKSVSGFDTKVVTVQAVEGNPRQLRIQGISANATTITIQQEDKEPQSYDVRVKHDTRDIEVVLKQTFPGEEITVDAITETTVLLKGSVSAELIRERAVSLAEQFYPSVLDHLEVRSATYEVGTVRSPNLMEQDPSTESLFQSVMRLSSRAAAIKADLNGETGELRNRPKDDPRAIEVREQLNVGLAQIRAEADEYQKFVTSALDLGKSPLENARSDLDRHRQLSEKGAVPISELRKSEAALVKAEAAFKQLTQIQEVLSSITASAADAQGRAY
jgi:hypothetical protein